MTDEEKIRLLMKRIDTLHEELMNNPQYTNDFIESINADIEYYQNQIDYLVNHS